MKSLLLITLLLLTPQPPPAFRIAIDVNLVQLTATVRDRDGHLVPGLDRQHFQIYEDGILQTIRVFRHEDTPVAVGLVIDHSGSMKPKIDSVLAASLAFVRVSNPNDRMFVVNFNERVFFGLSASNPFTSSIALLESAILRTPAAGMTALYDAIAASLEQVKSATLDRSVLLVVSDGKDNSSHINLERLLLLAAQSNTMIYTFGIFAPDDPDRNPGPLRQLAASTGGESNFPKHLSDLDALAERIAREIRNQYTLGYVSTQPAIPGARRKLRVAAELPALGKLITRTRTSYTVEIPR